jgi:SOS-response transcriptional repressor LexA
MLREIEKKTLLTVNERIEKTGFVPSRREIAAAIGMSTDTVQRALDRLEKEGFVRRLRDTPRAIRVLKLPADSGTPA